ncbi:hypothetical protein BAUCODRAFT_148317 [Baudoinia panamericana UAMH 10762]|uniref:GST N-terminal domain-containing protein n=1 Tax=Baudoinia panamericana (strain UAMH 10762) TaxID=717646 RepID=M2LQP8_BAUPA|nr:uncharacterized protein BAUCODRAFT_148317 [Baudoinia panamericana UAMH 10762]EMC96757.1 hypothetical protein BAUCODRAFT_148317 [Baudoinia panamericana UAMH 10762]
MTSLLQKVIGGGVKAEKPIKLYGHAGGPNPWKVAVILRELDIPYDMEIMDFGDLKKEPFESINPNGRVPAIEDPNTGYKLWESGAIIDYLIETYDTTNSLFYTSGAERGQRAWFVLYHSEKDLTSALDQYGGEVKRTIGVIDRHLKKIGQPYLCGEKISYADLMFMPWHWLVLYPPHVMGEGFPKEWESEFSEAWR